VFAFKAEKWVIAAHFYRRSNIMKFNYVRLMAIAVLANLLTLTAYGQENTLKGKVIDEEGNGIAKATVQLLNESFGTVTDDQGNFTLKVNTSDPVVIIRAVGFATRQAQVTVSNEKSVDFKLRESVTQLPDLVVTAEKEEFNLLSVPYSVSSLEAEKIEQYRIWNIREISTIVPNLYSADPGDNRNVTSIRGITTTSYDPAVATYIDGVNQFSLDTYIAPLFDVERIEVLRGPQSTLYGRNAMGGVINVITKAPGNAFTGFAEISAGNMGQKRFSAGIRTPLIKDKLFLGVAGLYEGSDGYYDNSFYSNDFDKRHSVTGNYYLMYNASGPLSLTLNVKHHSHRNDGAFTLSYLDEAFANPYTVNQNAVGQLIDNSINTSLKAGYKTGSVNVTSLTSYQSNIRYYDSPLDGDFSPIDGITIINDYRKPWNFVEVFTEELKVSSLNLPDDKINWTVGTYMFLQENPVKQAVRFGEDAAYVGADDTNFSLINTTEGKNKGIAFYGQATLNITDKLSVTGGIRYDYEKRKQSVKGEYQHDPDPNPIFETIPDTTSSANFNAVSPKASIQYDFNEHSTVYASYSRGFRAGGLTQLSSDPSQPPLYSYDPEFSNNFELGSKNLLMENRVQFNMSLFYVTVNDAQVPTLILPDAITVIRNTGELKTTGVEAELTVAPVRGLSIECNFGLTESEYRELEISQAGEAVNLEGNHQIFTPNTTARAVLQYTFKPKQSDFKGFVRGEVAHTGTVYFDLANSIEQEPYSLIHARAGVSYKNFELSGWVRNISDKTYIAYAYDFGAVHLGEPRSVGVSLRTTF
jgi:iron complex outermembrane recepter protein